MAHYFTKSEQDELTQLWHTARIAGAITRWERLQYAAREFCKAHPEVKNLSAYLEIDGITRGY